MELIIHLIPIVVILLVLILWKKHMMVAGLIASLVAILIGRINLHDGAALITGGINTMFPIHPLSFTPLQLSWYPKAAASRQLSAWRKRC